MKFIKLFENFNGGFYEVISSDEYDNSICYDLDSKYIKILSSRVKDIYKLCPEVLINKDGSHYQGVCIKSEDDLEINISESDDEWFYVEIIDSSDFYSDTCILYKCDQFDGLIKLLEFIEVLK